MGVDFDVAEFCRKLRPQDPPYTCPVESCGKLYHSIVGLNYHLTKFDHNNPSEKEATPPPQPTPVSVPAPSVTTVTPKTPANKISHPKPRSSLKSSRKRKAQRANLLKNAIDQKMVLPPREGLTYAEAQTMVEFDRNGSSVRYKISEPLQFTDKEKFEAEFGQTSAKQESNESMTHTPVATKKHSHSSSSKKKSSNKLGSKATPVATAEEKVRLPEPCFKILENYSIADAPPRPTLAYIRFIERSAEEMDGEVEYDMDEEDSAWLSIINERRGTTSLPPVPIDAFELLMDRLEKESYFQMQVNGPSGDSAPSIIDDDAVCCICMDGECQNSNVILFCDMCNLAVHQDCYGVPYIPEGQWLCRRCLQSPSRAVDCVLCPNNGGAFKQTDRSLWAHVVCALWIPEVRFANTVFLEPIDSIETIPPARWKLTCYICKQKGVGACIQCHKTNCYAAFHVTCAQHAGLYMKMDTVRDTEPGPVMVQKTAYCDAHTPPDAEPRPKINSRTGGGILAISPPSGVGSPGSTGSGSPDRPREEKREKMKEARRILAKRRSSVPIISIPTIPPERIQEIASLVTLPKKNQFIQRLIAYWTLKRQFRNGVPLLRRLQSAHHSQRRDDGRTADATNDTAELFRQLKYWQCLRQDLERARLLCELVRKREKMKREYMKVVEAATMLKLNPFQNFLLKVLDNLQAKDSGEIFAEPVDLTEVPDYMDVVKEPMDISTMRSKVGNFKYSSLDALQKDFNLMVANCLAYNSKETVFYRAGIRMRDQGGTVFRQARRDSELVGFDPNTGLLLPTNDGTGTGNRQKSVSFRTVRKTSEKRPETPDSEPTESNEKPVKMAKIADALSVEIDARLNNLSTKGNAAELEKTLNALLELEDMARMVKSPVARNKRSRTIRKEIAKVRRRMSTLNRKSSKQDTDTADTNTEEDESTECEDDPVPTKAAERIHEDSHGKKRESESSSKNQPQSSTEEKTFSSGKRGRKRRYNRDGSDDEANSSDGHKAIVTAQVSAAITPEKDTVKGSNSSALTTPVTPIHPEGFNNSPSGALNNSKGSLSSSSPSGVNRRTAVLFRKAAGVFRKPDAPGSPASMNSDPGLPVPIKRRAGRPRKNLDSSLGVTSDGVPGVSSSSNPDASPDSASRLMPAPPAPVLNSDSFRVYRSGGDIVTETDEDTQSETSCSSCPSTEDLSGSSCDEEGDDDADSGASSGLDCTSPRTGSGDEGEEKREKKNKGPLLPPLQLVWAKCRGYPWYPALIIDPKMPAGYIHHGVPIPAPPPEVLALAANYSEPVHLVLFFDTKRTWQWLPRNKLELLGEDRSVDQSKLTESRKPTDRKAVRKAYQEAMLHRREVTGIEAGLIEDTEALDDTT